MKKPRFPDNPEDYRMSLGEHLEELRRRVIYALAGIGVAMAGCFFFGKSLIAFITEPVRNALSQLGADTSMVILEPTEAFVTIVKMAFMMGLVISSPWVLYHIWIFVATGLYQHERRVVHTFVPFSAVLFIAGTAFAYKIALKYGLRLLIGFGGLMDLARPTIRLSSAINFVMMTTVVMGAVFQLPLVMMILSMARIVDSRTYVKHWRYAVGGIFLCSAILTPPDVVTQLAMAGPMIALYWLGVLLARTATRRRKRRKPSIT